MCICTFKRSTLLRQLLEKLNDQQTEGLFSYSLVIVDNDSVRSAEAVVAEFARSASIRVTYDVEPQQSIARARNKAIENAIGDFVAFIDDDEFPTNSWLLTLFKVSKEYRVEGVLGPVKPHFLEGVPRWLVQGKFYERPVHPTGLAVEWPMARSGNVLFKKEVYAALTEGFNPEFRCGSDVDFFRRAMDKGYVFIWSADAVVYEVVPRIRWKRWFLLRRALFRGSLNHLHPTFGVVETAKAVIAILVYTIALPFALILGQHRFMAVSVRLFQHLGKLLGLVGVNPIKDQYITE
ncbi:MAG: glycosyltransferase [Candidatus Korobacteraceae bacterium]